MFERIERGSQIAFVLLGVLLLIQVTRLFSIEDPLAGVDLPDLAVLSPPSNAAPATAGSDPPPPPGMPPRFGGPRSPIPLPTNIQNQVDTIHRSEILGPIPRPQPLMLLGIAGPHAFLQTPTGQSGLAAEGEEMGGIKVIRIGTNRVLIEVDHQPQELILFPGLAGESLLPNPEPPRP